MEILKLIYFNGCPNAERARRLLKQNGLQFEEINQDLLPEKHPYKKFSSPTVLENGHIVFGSEASEGGGCSIDIPDFVELQKRLKHSSMNGRAHKPKPTVLSTIGSLGSAFTAWFCPACIPALSSFLSAIGLGFLVRESVIQSLLFVFIGITLLGLLWSYFKEHRKIVPFLIGSIMSIGLYVGRYVFISQTVNALIMWGSIIGIISVSFWNIKLKKGAGCTNCLNND